MATLMMLTYPILQGRRDRRRGWRRSPVECPLAAAEWHDEEGQGSSPGPSAHLLFTCVKQNIISIYPQRDYFCYVQYIYMLLYKFQPHSCTLKSVRY